MQDSIGELVKFEVNQLWDQVLTESGRDTCTLVIKGGGQACLACSLRSVACLLAVTTGEGV